MRSLWLLSLVAALALAGCADDAGDDDTMDDEPMAREPVLVEVLTFSDSGTIMLGNDSLGNTETGCGNMDQDGFDTARFPWEIPAEVNGTPVKARSAQVVLTLTDPTNLDSDLYLHGPSGAEIARSTDFNVQTSPTETIQLENLDAGTYEIVVRGCTGSGAFTVEAEAELYSVVEMTPAPDAMDDMAEDDP